MGQLGTISRLFHLQQVVCRGWRKISVFWCPYWGSMVWDQPGHLYVARPARWAGGLTLVRFSKGYPWLGQSEPVWSGCFGSVIMKLTCQWWAGVWSQAICLLIIHIAWGGRWLDLFPERACTLGGCCLLLSYKLVVCKNYVKSGQLSPRLGFAFFFWGCRVVWKINT